ncbi:MAG: hypothetical protein K6348_08165 [Deferribacterales bacterium]
MDLNNFENSSYFFFKLIDGLNLSKNRDTVVFDASFTELLIPEYLYKKYNYNKIYYLSNEMQMKDDTILPVKIEYNTARSIMKKKSDLFISLGGTLRFQPLYDMVHAIHSNLNVGGRYYLAVYPDIYDTSGRDILNGLSLISEFPVKEKLNRWQITLKNALSNIFMRVDTEQVITQAESQHVINFFNLDNVKKTIFKEYDVEKFFLPIKHLTVDYMISWNIIKGIKI